MKVTRVGATVSIPFSSPLTTAFVFAVAAWGLGAVSAWSARVLVSWPESQ